MPRTSAKDSPACWRLSPGCGSPDAYIHRKNSLFYKTQNGAHVGDIYMTLIYTTERARGDPFHYLVELQHHPEEVAKAPADWMPWSYRDTLAALQATDDG
jgi:hypothetical protein